MKKLSIAAIIVTMVATCCVAASEMASAEHSELLMKLMAFISLMLIDIYVIVSILKEKDK